MQYVVLALAHAAVFFVLPLPAAAYVCDRARLRPRLTFGCVVLLDAMFGYVGFFVWLLSPVAGFAYDLAVLAGLAAFWFTPWRRALASSDAIVTLALVAAVIATYASALSFSADSHSILAAAERRFVLANDDVLPKAVADRLVAASDPRVLTDGWLSSDRPPLQTGLDLLQRPLVSASQWDASSYTLISLAVELMWIPALLATLGALGLSRRRAAVSVVLLALTSFAFINSVYVWPKFLAAALFLYGMLALRDDDASRLGLSRGQVCFAAASLALAMLSHGGVFFSIVGLGVAAFSTLRTTSRHVLFSGAMLGTAILGPWLMYQNVYDPPGNRLMKWHLAGVVPIEGRTLSEALSDQYGLLGPAGAFRNKLANVQTLVSEGGLYVEPAVILPLSAPLAMRARSDEFYLFFASPGVLLLGFAGIFFGGRATFARGSFARYVAVVAGFSVLAWCLLMFGPAATMNLLGSYANNLLLATLALALLQRLPRPAIAVVAALSVTGFMLSCYLPFTQPWPASAEAVSDVAGAIAAFALVVGSLGAAFRLDAPSNVPA